MSFNKTALKPGDIVEYDLVWGVCFALVLSEPRIASAAENRRMGVFTFDEIMVLDIVRMDTGKKILCLLEDIRELILDNRKQAC